VPPPPPPASTPTCAAQRSNSGRANWINRSGRSFRTSRYYRWR
jgi:hypothetical protein